MDPFESFKATQKQGWRTSRRMKRTLRLARQRWSSGRAFARGNACWTLHAGPALFRLRRRGWALGLRGSISHRNCWNCARENAHIAAVEVDWHEGDAGGIAVLEMRHST